MPAYTIKHIAPDQALITFREPPDANICLKACSEAKNEWNKAPVIGHRHLWTSPDKLQVTIQFVDIMEEIESGRTTDTDNYICQYTITCRYCRSIYTGYKALSKRMFKPGPYHIAIDYCPSCPPGIDVNTWLIATVGLMPDRPEYRQVYEQDCRSAVKGTKTTIAITNEDLEAYD